MYMPNVCVYNMYIIYLYGTCTNYSDNKFINFTLKKGVILKVAFVVLRRAILELTYRNFGRCQELLVLEHAQKCFISGIAREKFPFRYLVDIAGRQQKSKLRM